MDKETARVVKKFAKRIRKAHNIQKVILFGSRARGDQFRTSDYDFFIVSKDFSGMRAPARMTRMLEFWNERRDLETICFTPEEFERRKPLMKGILSKAVEIS
ncbi:MAG: nucleotidyltransferase domain-containing protein [Candidatus Aenigmatarchaeota archaeon]